MLGLSNIRRYSMRKTDVCDVCCLFGNQEVCIGLIREEMSIMVMDIEFGN